MKQAKNYLKYLIKFYSKCGLDIDYVDKLNSNEAEFLCQFILENYGGITENIPVKKSANHHRYATRYDILICKSVPSSENIMKKVASNDIDVESYFIIKQIVEKKLKK
jgi:hypothetical protein